MISPPTDVPEASCTPPLDPESPTQPPHDPRVVRPERRAAGRHCRAHPRQVHGHHVGVALDDDHPLVALHVLLGQVDAVEHVRLLVERGLGGVQVLRALVLLEQPARAEPDRLAGHLADRPHEPSAEPVVDAALALADQPGRHQLRLGEPAPAQVPHERVPPLRREADPEVGCRGPVEPALRQERSPGCGFGRAELLAVELLGHLVRLDEPAALARLLARTRCAALLVPQLDADLAGQVLDRLGEPEPVDLLHEVDDVAALAATEAVVPAHLRADVEGGRALVVERAQALHRSHARGLQGDVLPDDLVDVGALADGLHVLPSDASRHAPSLGASTDMTRREPRDRRAAAGGPGGRASRRRRRR